MISRILNIMLVLVLATLSMSANAGWSEAQQAADQPLAAPSQVESSLPLGAAPSDLPVPIDSGGQLESVLGKSQRLSEPRVDESYSYWFPFIDPNSQPGDDWLFSYIGVNAIVSTSLFIDSNFNGVWDEGELSAVLEPSSEPIQLFDRLLSGPVRLVSDQPVQAFANFIAGDNGPYDEQHYQYAPATPGMRFIVPIGGAFGLLHIVATEDNTDVQLHGSVTNLDMGERLQSSANAGDLISSNRPIAVTLIVFNRDNRDTTAAVSLIPTQEFGTQFWIPPLSELNSVILEDNQRLVITHENGTVETRPVPSDSTLLTLSAPAAMYYYLDVLTDDPASWADRRRQEIWALLPSNQLGTRYANGGYLLSTRDGNHVQIDSDYDGIYELHLTLNAGEMYPPSYQRNPGPHYSLFTPDHGDVLAEYPIFARQIYFGAWYGVDEHIGGTEQRPIPLDFGFNTPTPTQTPSPTSSPTSTRTATPSVTPTVTATYLPGTPTPTPPLPTPTATPDFPVCTVTVDKIAYPSTARIDGQVGVTLKLIGDCPGEIGAAVDVALVIDRSASMCGPKLDQAQDAGQAFLDSMALPPDQASVISFAGAATLHTGLTTNRTQATNALYNITCGGISRLDVGLNRAFDEMTGPRRVAGHTPAVIVLTDGNPTGVYADDVRAAAQRLRGAGVQLYTVGLGADVNASLLREIATAPDHYYQSPTPDQLVQIYSRLAGELRMAPGFNVNLTDIVGQQFEVVPGSFSGAGTPTVNGRTLSWYLPRIEQGVTEVSFVLRPLQCGVFNTNQSAQVAYDDNRGNRRTLTFPSPTVTITGCDAQLTDLFIRDNPQDIGIVPSDPPWWASPDIWIRHADDGGAAHQNPQAGQRNYLYARVLNRGTTTVNTIGVAWYYGASGLGLGWPVGWTALTQTRTVASLAPGASAVVSIPWDVPNIAGHFCFRVHISAAVDPILDYRIAWENNVAQRNLHVVAYPQPPAGQCMFDENGMAADQVSMDVINTLNTSSLVDVELTASGLPTTAEAWLLPGALANRWSSLDGLVLEPDGRLRVLRFPARLYGIRLNPNEMRSVSLDVRAPVNSRFTVGLAQYVRGSLVGGNSYQRVLPPCPIYLPNVVLSGSGCQPGRTYTWDADFDEGLLINVNHNAPNNHQLQLNDAVTPLPYIWIALSGRGTIAKVNTQTGVVLGEYLSAPNGRSRNPSRTTVDLNGNVWVGNRDESTGGKGSVVQIGLRENFQCVDRNGNGVIDTSTGLGDVKPWPNPGGVDNNGGVSSAQDECIVNYVRTNGTNVRTVAVDARNDVWVGGFTNQKHDLIDGDTGAVLRSITPACGGYGGLVDSQGVLWSAQYSTRLLRYDPVTGSSLCIPLAYSYGLGVDGSGVIWNSQYDTGTVTRLNPAGAVLGAVSTGGSGSRGVAVTSDDHIWIANSASNTVTRLRNDGTRLATIPVGTTPTGVSVDAVGKVWVTNYGSNNAMRINPATNAVDLTVPLGAGAQPYNYSDMTGSVVLGSPPQGKWVVVHDSGAAGTPWGSVSWNSQVPAGTSLSVRVRSAQTSSGLGSQPWVAVSNGVPFTTVPAGRYLQIEVQFTGTDAGASPILYDLTVSPSCALASGAEKTTP